MPENIFDCLLGWVCPCSMNRHFAVDEPVTVTRRCSAPGSVGASLKSLRYCKYCRGCLNGFVSLLGMESLQLMRKQINNSIIAFYFITMRVTCVGLTTL